MGLQAGLLLGAHARPPWVVSGGGLVRPLAEGLDVWGTGRGVFGALVREPIA